MNENEDIEVMADMVSILDNKTVIPKRGNRNKWIHTVNRDPQTGLKVLFEKMTVQQDLFCQYVAEGFNNTESYRRAYPESSAPHVHGHQLFKLEKIQKRINFLRKERAALAMQVSPQESLSRWNFLYFNCLQAGDIKGAMEAQKNIDKINGSQDAFAETKKEASTFRGEEAEWQKTAKSLMNVLGANKIMETPVAKESVVVDKRTDELSPIEATDTKTTFEDMQSMISTLVDD